MSAIQISCLFRMVRGRGCGYLTLMTPTQQLLLTTTNAARYRSYPCTIGVYVHVCVACMPLSAHVISMQFAVIPSVVWLYNRD